MTKIDLGDLMENNDMVIYSYYHKCNVCGKRNSNYISLTPKYKKKNKIKLFICKQCFIEPTLLTEKEFKKEIIKTKEEQINEIRRNWRD